ncbi:MAG: hypothetical protein BHW25_04175 [Faecalibacterium sp. CAG:82-related_59_9]|nr:MAG: hypothetical protein BHW25_04175 [Faecalibacterium sp. CAG:82-related_59_9]
MLYDEQPLTFRTTRNLCDALGVERFVRNSQDVSIDVDQGFCRDSGNFFVLLRFAFPEDQGYEVTYTSGALYWNRQDTFSREYFTLEDRGDWVERNYTTSAGNTVLILTSPSQERGYILCNRGDALMTVWLDANPEILSEDSGVVSAEYLHMTEKQLNMVADALDFAIQPNVPTQADVDAQAAPPQEATQNGYTLKLNPKWIVHPDYDPQGFTYFQFPSEGVGSPTLVLGLPLKSLLFDDSIPVDIHLEIPAHDVSVTLTGSVTPVVNSLSAPTDLIQDSDIASFVQLRQTLEQIAQLVQSTLNAIQ